MRVNVSLGSDVAASSNCTRVYPIFPPGPTNWPPTTGVAGPTTAVGESATSGRAARFSCTCAMAAAFAVSVSEPVRTANTTLAVSPDCDGKRCSRRSAACCDCAPGIVKTSTVSPPDAFAPTTSPVASTSQTRIVSQW